ncbi:MAG: cation-translocating P-type ATPase [Hydrogenophaga sp.]|uniref:heavy metal translocating P-type ATPase n=1 Tax=Hydrogenophaga sp. TaxID=1904254 RepID=UPI002723DECB|nr:cation-translocating P-type ATPase [Hydrogenophaga sp.]MDO9149214.1 cation-translocating P-type ATPase [Hydrogenophaga sp.]MDO9605797.1 cation-translocating P-type ATPase [Hydrogenophaga sp.]MDP2166541.1 cation-translocating P-type ATPase [Hydrogenophaga sp.]MDP3476052.1 cation-translocating P-type ATPase [Hydrogenophaga sp.]
MTDNFGVLDDPVELREFTDFSDVDGTPTAVSVLMVQGMYCAACADTVESALQHLPGVERAHVHAATRRLTLHWNPALTSMSSLARAVGDTGYRLLPIQQALSISERLRETRQALWRLFVAGFCSMQVMMYAWPAYVTEPGEIPADIDQLLRWASWVLSLPVVFFASGPFFSSAWRDLKHGRVGMDTPVSIGILVTFIASSGSTFDPTGPWGYEVWFDSLTMFVFFLLGGRYLELKARDRTAGALDSLMNRLPEVCDLQKPDGSFEAVSIRRLATGDVVRLQAGQAFPGDGTVLSESATVDEALLTGESRPVIRERGGAVVAGSFNLGGPVLLRVDKLGRDTRFAQIVSLMEKASTEKPRLAILVDRIAAPFLVAVLVAAAFAAWYWWQIDPNKALAVAVAVLIVTCPCALSLATPAAMLSSAGALARRGILVRRLQAFESLANINAVVFDKTGTLTHDRLVLDDVHTRAGVSRDQALELAGQMAAGSLHPVSRALASAAVGLDAIGPEVLTDMAELAGQGMQALRADGSRLRLGSAAFCGVSVSEAAATDAGDSPRVYLSDEQGWLATFTLQEGLRDDAQAAVAALRAMGVRTWLLSGDRDAAAQLVGQAVGVDHVISGASPEQKLAEVSALQAQGIKLAMVGDGLNDGPVLARADTSFALGHAAPLAQAQSDYVIQGGEVMDVVRTLQQARCTLRIVRQNLMWAATYNLVCVPLALFGFMPPWLAGLGMAGSSLLVIGNALRLASKVPSGSSDTVSGKP